MSEKKKRQIRLIDVSEKAYLILLEFKAKESQRLRRACNLTDGFERMAKEAVEGKRVEVTIGDPELSVYVNRVDSEPKFMTEKQVADKLGITLDDLKQNPGKAISLKL